MLGNILPLDADGKQHALAIPRRRRHFGVYGKGPFAGRQCVVVREVIDQFFNANGIARRQLPVVEHAPDVAIAAGINVDAEG